MSSTVAEPSEKAPRPHTVAVHDVAPFAAWLGLQVESAGDGHAVMRLASRAEMLNRRDVFHGGVLAALLDSVMARSARAIAGVRELGGTTDLHVQYMRPAVGDLRAEGWVQHAASTLAFCRGEVRNAAGELVAAGTASLRLRR